MVKIKRSFSLVELLVVIGIISVLAGLLLPSLQGAMQQAQLTSCASQQKQLYLSVSLYTEDNLSRFPDWNGNLGWSPMTSIANPYYKSCQLGRVLSNGYMGKELLVDPGFVNNTDVFGLVYQGSVRWDRVNPITSRYLLPANHTTGTYSLYLWQAFATSRRFSKPIGLAVTMCRQDSLSLDTMNHERKMMNVCYEDGHGRTIDAEAGHLEMVIRNVDAKINGSASAYQYNWWNYARDKDR